MQQEQLSYLKLRPKQRRFIDAYLTSARYNATEAARQAGYGSPQTLGGRLLKKLKYLIEEQELRLRESALVSPKQVMEGLSEIAQNAENRASDRTKAYEILARIHGMLQDKVSIDGDLTLVRRELGTVLAQVVEASIVEDSDKLSAGDSIPMLTEGSDKEEKIPDNAS